MIRLKIMSVSFLITILFFLNAIAQEKIEITFEETSGSNGVPLGWELKERKGDAEFKILKENNETIAYFKSVSASFSLEKPLQIDPIKYPYIYWSWKVIRLPVGGDVRLKKKNDQAAQLLIAFEGKKIISYVWDTSAPEGTITDESIGWPINAQIKIIVVKSGSTDLNKWVSFNRNIVEDYKKLYNESPPFIKGVRVQINTQNTKTIAESFFGKIVLKMKPI